ncbi:MAG: hypothetical protein M1816_006572 [Peltula sp. TS41687]|nr:MAG: hypothetical protein M1816_006572 [Peltula sp. TS41687]
MDAETAAQAALLEWINDFDMSDKISSMTELSDGLMIWKLLCHIDPQHFTGELPSPDITDQDNWLPKLQNLKKIYKDLTRYLTSKCDKIVLRDEVFSPDFKMIALAEESGVTETVKVDAPPQPTFKHQADIVTQLLKMILLAAINSPEANNYLVRMTALSVPAQAAIRSIIEEMALLSKPSDLHVDHELLLEEQLAQIVAANKTLQHEKMELQAMVKQMNDRVEGLVKKIVELKAKGEHDPEHDMMVQELKRRMQIENLRSTCTDVQELQDTCDELRAERDNLVRKANTVDRYRQKLEAMQVVEQEAQELRTQLEDMRQLADHTEEHSQGLEMTIEKYRQTLETIEQQNYELQTVKRQFELENKLLTERSENLAEENAHNVNVISSLQEKLTDLEARKGIKDEGADLQSQLQTEDDDRSVLSDLLDPYTASEYLDRSLDKTTARSQNKESVSGEVVMMQKLLEDAKTKNERVERLYLDTKERVVVLEHAISKDVKGSTGLDQEANTALSKMRTKVSNLEAELANTKSKLAEAITDLGMLDKDKLKALRGLQESEFPELIALRDDRSRLQALVATTQVDLEQQRSLLTKTLLDKDAVQKSLLAAKDDLHHAATTAAAEGRTPYKESAQIRLNIAAPDMDAWSAMEKRLLQDQDKAAKTRQELVKDAEVMKSFFASSFGFFAYDHEHRHQQRRPAAAADQDRRIKRMSKMASAKDFLAYSETKPDDHGTAGSAPAGAGDDQRSEILFDAYDDDNDDGDESPSRGNFSTARRDDEEEEPVITNLRRENRLMASAWYDLNSRLQLNNVDLQRRREEPRSWIKKQRQIVNDATR